MPACTHGFPKPSNCVTCMDEGNLPPAPRPPAPTVVGWAIGARFPGHCRGCNLAIHEGQQIVRMTDDTYRHEVCSP